MVSRGRIPAPACWGVTMPRRCRSFRCIVGRFVVLSPAGRCEASGPLPAIRPARARRRGGDGSSATSGAAVERRGGRGPRRAGGAAPQRAAGTEAFVPVAADVVLSLALSRGLPPPLRRSSLFLEPEPLDEADACVPAWEAAHTAARQARRPSCPAAPRRGSLPRDQRGPVAATGVMRRGCVAGPVER